MADVREILLKLLGKETVSDAAKKAARGLGEMGDAADGAAKDAKALDKQIADTRKGIEDLTRALAKDPGDTGLEKQLRKLRARGRFYDSLKKDFDNLGDGAAVGFAARFSQRIGPLIASAPMSGPMMTAAGTAAAAAAPLVAATISAGVTAGLSGGVIAAGVKLALKDPEVEAVATGFTTHLGTLFGDAAQPFRDKTIDAIEDIGGELVRLGPEFRGLFTDASKHVESLTNAVTGFGRELLPGVRTAVRESGPLFDMVEEHGPRAGRALSDAFASMARSSDGAAQALDGVLTLTEEVVRNTGGSLALLSDAAPYLTGVLPMIGDLSKKTDEADQETKGLAESLRIAAGASEEAKQALLDQLAALDSYTSATMAGQSATLDIEEAIDSLKGQVKEHGTSLDETTEKGRANQRFIQGWIGSINAKAEAVEQAALADGQSAEAAAAAGAKIRQTLVKDLVSAATKAGLSEKKIKDLVAAVNEADGKRLRIFYDSIYRTFGKPGTSVMGIGGSDAKGRASGGPITRGRPYLVGEQGPELVVPNADATVLTAAQTRRALNNRTPGAGTDPVRVDVRVSWAGGSGPAGDIGQTLMRFLRYEVRTQGGGNVQTALGA